MSQPNLETHDPQNQVLDKEQDTSEQDCLKAQLSLELQLRSNTQQLLNLYKKSQNWPAVNQLAQTLITGSQRITKLKASLESQQEDSVQEREASVSATPDKPVHRESTPIEEAQTLLENFANQLNSSDSEESSARVGKTIRRSECGKQSECFGNEALHTKGLSENNKEQYTEAVAAPLHISDTVIAQQITTSSECSSYSSSPVKSSYLSKGDISESNSDLFFSPPESLSLENDTNSGEQIQGTATSRDESIESSEELIVAQSQDTTQENCEAENRGIEDREAENCELEDREAEDREVEQLDSTLLEIDSLLADFVPEPGSEMSVTSEADQLPVVSEQQLANGTTPPLSVEQATNDTLNTVTQSTVVSSDTKEAQGSNDQLAIQSEENSIGNGKGEEQCVEDVIVKDDDATLRDELPMDGVPVKQCEDEESQNENQAPSIDEKPDTTTLTVVEDQCSSDNGCDQCSNDSSSIDVPTTTSQELPTGDDRPCTDTPHEHSPTTADPPLRSVLASDDQTQHNTPEVGSEQTLPLLTGSEQSPLKSMADGGTDAIINKAPELGPSEVAVGRDEETVESSTDNGEDIVNDSTVQCIATEELPLDENVLTTEISNDDNGASSPDEHMDTTTPLAEQETRDPPDTNNDEPDGPQEVGIMNLSNCVDIVDKLEESTSTDENQAPLKENDHCTDDQTTVDKLSEPALSQQSEQSSPVETPVDLATLNSRDPVGHTVKSVSPTNSPFTSDEERREPLYRSLESSPTHKKVKKRKSMRERLRKSLTTSFTFTSKKKESPEDLPNVRPLSPITGTEWDPTCLLEELYSDFRQGGNVASKSGESARHFGYLQKLPMNKTKATFSKGYKRRYFRAMEGKLYYYEDRTVEKALGFVKLESSRIVPLPDVMQIQVVQKDGKSLMLKSADSDDFSVWHKHLLLEAAHPTQSNPGSPLPVEKPTVIIIDIGACSVRAGYATDDAYPELFFPAVSSLDVTTNADSGCGIAALQPENRYGSVQVYPRKVSIRMDQHDSNMKLRALDVIINYIVETLDVNTSTTNVILTMSPTVPEPDRNDLVELLFESYGFAGVCIQEQAILALYSYNTTSGLVVDIGDHVDIIPIIDGYAIEAGVTRLPFGGNAITESLLKLITQKGIRYFSETESYVVRLIKEKLCFVSQDYLEDCTECDANVAPYTHAVDVDLYQLADHRKVVTLDSARFKAPEGLFTPSHWGKDVSGLHEHIWRSIQACPIDQRKQLAKSIYLSGGTSLLPGLQERLQMEVGKLAGPGLSVEVHAGPNRQHAAYVGASLLANLSSFRRVNVVTSEEWADCGVDCLQKWNRT